MTTPPPTRRLIENWLPINEISVEGIREGGALAGHPPVNQLHVWWARRPLVASRSAVAASLLNADADHSTFIQTIGSTETVVAERRQMDAVKASGQWSNVTFSNKRAFTHNLSPGQAAWFRANLAVADPVVLDVTAGGGSIPFEAGRLGLNAIANELNPVAALILRATCQWPQQYGNALLAQYRQVSARFQERVKDLLEGVYPDEKQPDPGEIPSEKFSRIVRHQIYVWAYIWCRTIECPACQREIPLSPNWRLDTKGAGVCLLPDTAAGICRFQVVYQAGEQSGGTVKGGIATCPYPTCGNTTAKGYLTQQAQAGRMGERLYCVIQKHGYQERQPDGEWKDIRTPRDYPSRTFREPEPADDNAAAIQRRLAERAADWERDNILPNEPVPELNDQRPLNYGMSPWRYMFSPRQQLAHGYCVQAFRELVAADKAAGALTEIRKAAWCYIALALDKLFAYNSLLTTWHSGREVLANLFASHDFGMKWSYAEMAVTIRGLGLEWAARDLGQCLRQITAMAGHTDQDGKAGGLLPPEKAKDAAAVAAAPGRIISGPAQDLDLPAASIDAIVFDPPYHNNVNYAELSDFFYVWLKRTAGYIFPEFFQPYLTDKVNEAIASPARFREQARGGGAAAGRLATEDYQDKMAAIFRECRRVIKPAGIMTVMFTHKSNAAWDAVTIALIAAGFSITRTWPIKTEADSALNIRDRAAARSTILLVCRPQERNPAPAPWHIVESRIAAAVRADIPRLQSYGLSPVDLYLAAFGPALQVISENWGAERAVANPDRREDEFAVTPGDALEVARREVIAHRTREISERWADGAVDPLTRFYILAQDGAGAAVIPFDEANLFARAMGVDLTGPEARRILSKQGDKVTLKSAQDRMAENLISEQRPAQTLLDQAHTAIALTHRQGSAAAGEWLVMQGHRPQSPEFKGTLEALLRVARPGHPDLAAGSSLWQLLYADPTPRPQQGVLAGLTADSAAGAAE